MKLTTGELRGSSIKDLGQVSITARTVRGTVARDGANRGNDIGNGVSEGQVKVDSGIGSETDQTLRMR